MRRNIILSVVLLLAAVVGVVLLAPMSAPEAAGDCTAFAQWDRRPGSLAPYPESPSGQTTGERERVTMFICGGGVVRAEIEVYRMEIRQQQKR